MPDLPSGTLTFLFSDIEGSTRHLQALGPSWEKALEEHHALLRRAVADHGGTEVGTEGDSFFVVFRTAGQAVAAATDAQRALAATDWPGGVDIAVRMGLHTGTASVAGGSYTGLDVHRTARIMSAAHGGQTVVSDATRALVAADLPDGVRLRDLGEHRLKDLGAPERLHQLVVEGLRGDFPALRSLDAAPNNLPIQLTTFLGRERQLAEIGALLERSRLVTLTGPGGTGKTRLSVHAAAQAAERFPDGVWFIPLAHISEPELVAPAVARALGVAERPGRSAVDAFLEHLDDRRVLLVLDNFEQVEPAAPLLAELLAGAPHLRLIVTSRALLRLSAEHEYPVPPLALPDPRRLPAAGELTRYEAIALFVERARAARPDFSLGERNAPAVAAICLRLDGLPLAIELAAARVRILPPEAILERLSRRLELLAGGPRDRPDRQRTLRGAIDWSHDLLEEADRRLFAALSVFVGGGALDAIERVCRVALGDSAEGDLLDGLASLVDKSLLREAEGPGGQPRFTMLETIREYALERSQASGGHGELQLRHAEWFAELAELEATLVMGPDQREVLDRLEQEHANLGAAITWSTENARPDLALRLTSRSWRMWQMRGHLAEGLERTSRALEMAGARAHPGLRADALEAAGGLAYWSGDVKGTREWYEQALAERRELGDRRAVAEALYNLAFAFSYVTQADAALDVDRARELGEEAKALFRELGDESGEARAEWMLTSVDAVSGDFGDMSERAWRTVDTFRRLGDRFYLAWALWSVAFAELGQGRPEAGRAPIREALEIFVGSDDVSGIGTMVEMTAMVALGMGDRTRAARLAGAAARAESVTGLDANEFPRAVLGFDRERLRSGDAATAWEEGERLSLSEAAQHALEVLGDGLDDGVPPLALGTESDARPATREDPEDHRSGS